MKTSAMLGLALMGYSAHASLPPTNQVIAADAKPFSRLRETVLREPNGTAFLVQGPSGKVYIMTNWHVCSSIHNKKRLVATSEDGKVYRGKLTKLEAGADLCAAVIPQYAGPTPLIPATSPGRDKSVWSRGFPYLLPAESRGELREYHRWDYEMDIEYLGECPEGSRQVRDPGYRLRGCKFNWTSQLSTLYGGPGASGSPAVNSNGELIGVVSSEHPQESAETGLVRFEVLKKFLGDL